MAYFYNDSAASGANDGTSTTDAWTDEASASGLSSGDVLWVNYTSSQSTASSVTKTQPDGIKIISSDFGDIVGGAPVYRSGAFYEVTGSASDLILRGEVHYIGMHYKASDKLTIDDSADERVLYDDCELESGDDAAVTSGIGGKIFLNGTDLTMNVNDFWSVSARSKLEMTGGTVTKASGSSGAINATAADGAMLVFNGVDFTGVPVASPIFHANDPQLGSALFNKCKFNAGFNLGVSNGPRTMMVETINCDTGTLVDAAFQYTRHDFYGDSESVVSHYKDGGSSDGEQSTPYSHKIVTKSNAQTGSRGHSVPLSIYIDDADGTDRTATISVAHNAVGSGTAGVLEDNQIHIVINGNPDTSTSLGVFVSTLGDVGQEAAIPTSSDTWTGSSVGTIQDLSVTFAPTLNGEFDLNVIVTEPSITVYIDAEMVVTS